MPQNIYSANKVSSRRSNQSKAYSKRKKHIIKRSIKVIKKDPIKIIALFFGGILLVIITILFILYANNSVSKESQFQKIESR